MRHIVFLALGIVTLAWGCWACAPPDVRAVRRDDKPDDVVTDPVDDPTAPVDDPPVNEPPVDEPPVDEPPVDEPPVDEPSVDEPSVDEAPVDEPGACDESARPTPNDGIVEPAGLDGCPPGMARIDDIGTCMDRWEAHLVVGDGSMSSPFAPFSPYFPVDGDEPAVARSAPNAVPQAYVSGVMAASACANAGKRLCTDVEWTRACRGASDRVFPYGDEREPGVCNDARDAHPAVEYFGTSASWIWSELGNPCIGQQHDTVERTGAHAECVDDSGRFFDLMGNLHEWIDDPAGTFRGGFYVDTALNGPGCLYRTTAHSTTHWDYSTGFRCCAD
jgi:sulfatase modifying factor 1